MFRTAGFLFYVGHVLYSLALGNIAYSSSVGPIFLQFWIEDCPQTLTEYLTPYAG